MTSGKLLAVVTVFSVFISGCSSNGIKKAESHAAQGNWLKAVMEYRSELEKDPASVELKSSLRQAELRAAEFYFQRGVSALAKDNYDAAIGSFEEGLAAMPGHEKLKSILHATIAKREAYELTKEGMRYRKMGDLQKEKHSLEKALELAPGDPMVLRQWQQLNSRIEKEKIEEFDLKTSETITLNFQETDIKKAFGFLSSVFGINVIFDDGVKDKKITLYAKNITFRQALNLMMGTTRTFYIKVARNTILLATDTKDKRGQYEDYSIRTYHLNNASAKLVSDVLKGVLSLQKVVVNEDLNTLTIRDTKAGLDLAEQLIQANDRKPAEIILEVDILEVNRTKATQLGFDYGSMISLEYPGYTVSGSFSETLRQGTVTIPAINFRYFKQNVDAKTLANPKIRVLDGKQAKIHIGDRVPLRSSTIQEATGQTRTTFQYTDIGIRLNVLPEIQLDNSSLVKLGLEVSSLGQNLGTDADPAYSLGTRNAETFMLLRDGETAILGGLIRDEERRTTVKVPGLGDMPVLGALFSSNDDSDVQTDVLLTITPRIIRPWQLPPKNTWNLYSGKADRYFSQPYITNPENDDRIFYNVGQISNHSEQALPTKTVLSFHLASYDVVEGNEVEVALVKSGHIQQATFPVNIRYDNDVLEFISLESTVENGLTGVENIGDGEIKALATLNEKILADGAEFARLRFKANKIGVSYILLGTNSAVGNPDNRYQISPGSAYVVVK